MSRTQWKIGELAARTGLTVRTLHHYDRIGLLRPSARTAAGHRLYAVADVVRLQQIRSLRQLGLSLAQVRAALDGANGAVASPLPVIERHLARLREQIQHQQRIHDRLDAIAVRLRSAGTVSAGAYLQAIEAMTMFEKYYTPEQLDYLAARRAQLGEARLREAEAEWPRLMAEVREEMAKGTDPADPRVRALASRWRELIEEFTGGDPGIARSLANLHRGEASVAGMETGDVRGMGEYLGRASAGE